MNYLDYFLILVLIFYTISGLVRGFLYAAFGALGLGVALIFGFLLIPQALQMFPPSDALATIAVLAVVAAAAFGGTVGGRIGTSVRGRLRFAPIRALDAGIGGVFAFIATVIVMWTIGYTATWASIPGLSAQARTSQVLASIDEKIPNGSQRFLYSFADLIDENLFPRYLDAFSPENITAVPEPDQGVLRDPDIQRARASTVQIAGEAEQCSRVLEGSGFIFAAGRVMTNAHVVAGVQDPIVFLGRQRFRAYVVVFDPDLDLAVLAVPALDGQELPFNFNASSGDSIAVLGFPEGGPLNVQPGRIRSREKFASTDIYGKGNVNRDVYAMRVLVRSGNSGGPVVSEQGEVLGMVFAASLADKQTGYALTAAQMRAGASQGIEKTQRTSTGNCA